MLRALCLDTTCLPVTVLSLLPTVPFPSSSECSHCHCSSCQMFERDPSYKKDTIIQHHMNICICTAQTANSKCVSSGFNGINIYFLNPVVKVVKRGLCF